VSDERDSLPMLSVDELEALWRVAWPMASGACRSTIKRLKCGLGGFYDADDFQQDAFLAFRDLALRWAAHQPRPAEDELWIAWRRRLTHGGHAILRRTPQRLWRRAPQGAHGPVPLPRLFSLDDPEGLEGEDDLPLLIDPEDVALRSAEAVDDDRRRALAQRVLRLLPAQQRRLVKSALEGQPLAELARELGLTVNAARTRRARALKEFRQVAVTLAEIEREESREKACAPEDRLA